MFKVFYGPNRLEAEKAIKQTLGDSYEVFEGEKLELADLPSISVVLHCLERKNGGFC